MEIQLNELYSNVLTEMSISFSIDDFSIFAAANIGYEKYTSLKYNRQKKSCNYFVRFNGEFYGKIHFFFKSCDIGLMMVELFDVIERIDHLLKVSASEVIIAEISVINEKLLYYEIDRNCYASPRPNRYEKE